MSEYFLAHICHPSLFNQNNWKPVWHYVWHYYRLLNEYSALGRVLWSEFDHRACEVINPTKERGPKTMYEFNNRIIVYLYKIINFIKYNQIYVGLLIIINFQPCNKRACNKQACNKRLYGTIASHDEVWQFNRGI